MGKKQVLALGIISIGFLLFFFKGFLSITTEAPFTSLFSFIALLICTVAAIFIGNTGTR